jgi:hypothetical protein
MIFDKLNIKLPSKIEELKSIIKRSKELIQTNPNLTEPEARKLATEELKNK